MVVPNICHNFTSFMNYLPSKAASTGRLSVWAALICVGEAMSGHEEILFPFPDLTLASWVTLNE